MAPRTASGRRRSWRSEGGGLAAGDISGNRSLQEWLRVETARGRRPHGRIRFPGRRYGKRSTPGRFFAESLDGPAVVTRIHGPESAVFRIPGDRRLDKLAIRILVQVGARMVAQPSQLNLLLDDVDLAAAGPDPLVAALIVSAVAPAHGVILPGCRVIIRVIPGVVLYGVFGTWTGKRSPHSRPAIAFVNPAMTGEAGQRFHVACFLACNKGPLGLKQKGRELPRVKRQKRRPILACSPF